MSEMRKLDLATLSKETLIAMLRRISRGATTLDGLWFLGVEERFGLEKAIEIDTESAKRFSSIDAKRIKRDEGITETGLPALAKALHFQSLMWGSFDYEVIEATDKVIYNVPYCGPQKARIRDGRGEFPCKRVGIAYFEEFVKVINPRIKTKCLACPPDEHPDDLWCSWEFTL